MEKVIEDEPSVRIAAPLAQHRVALVGSNGKSRVVTLFGANRDLGALNGRLSKRVLAEAPPRAGITVSESVAESLGVVAGSPLGVTVGDQVRRTKVAAVVNDAAVAPYGDSPIAFASLRHTQALLGIGARVQRILVAPAPDREEEAARRLATLTENTVDVRSSDTEGVLLKEAAKADSQTSVLLAVLGAVIGVLLSLNAVLLTMPRRRSLISRIRLVGASKGEVIGSLALEAFVLATLATLLGLFLGEQLARHFLNGVPEYLQSGFPIGDQQSVTAAAVVAAIVAGFGTTFAAMAKPMWELTRASASLSTSDDNANHSDIAGLVGYHRTVLLVAGIVVLGVGGLASVLLPTLPVVVCFVAGLVLLVPVAVSYLSDGARWAARNRGGPSLRLAISELSQNRGRGIALATIGALAVFGATAMQGMADDLRGGISAMAKDYYASDTSIVLDPAGAQRPYLTQAFSTDAAMREVRRTPGVSDVREAQGGLFDIGGRRVYVLAAVRGDSTPVAPDQIVDGDPTITQRLMKQGGWITLSAPLARHLNSRPGDAITIPTPSGPREFKVAALTTNYGWSSGALLVGAADYRNHWHPQGASAILARTTPGVPPAQAIATLNRRLETRAPGFRAQSAREHVAKISETSSQGVNRIGQIANMLLLAAVLAIVAAVLSATWQRRARLSSLRTIGMYRSELLRAMLGEIGLVLAVGCALGLAVGLYAQVFLARIVENALGFPVAYSPATEIGVSAVIGVLGITLLAISLPLRFAVNTSPESSFATE